LRPGRILNVVHTLVARFKPTARTTAGGIATTVVAFLEVNRDAVTTKRGATDAARRTGPTALDLTACIATVAGCLIAIVTRFVSADGTVATAHGRDTVHPGLGAIEIGLDKTLRAATVAANHIVVVTGFAARQ
jgi:hypothetical protein